MSLRDLALWLFMAHLERVTADDLRSVLAAVEGKQATQRVMVGLTYKEGISQAKLAEMYGVTEKTIYNWLCRLDRLADEPFEAVVYDDDRPGRPAKLSNDEREQFEQTLHHSPTAVGYDAPVWTAALAQEYIESTFGVDYCLRRVRALMSEAGLSYTTARQDHQNADGRGHDGFEEEFQKGWMI